MSPPSIKMRKIDMRITEGEYEALVFATRYIPTSSRASVVLRLILLNAKPDGEIL